MSNANFLKTAGLLALMLANGTSVFAQKNKKNRDKEPPKTVMTVYDTDVGGNTLGAYQVMPDMQGQFLSDTAFTPNRVMPAFLPNGQQDPDRYHVMQEERIGPNKDLFLTRIRTVNSSDDSFSVAEEVGNMVAITDSLGRAFIFQTVKIKDGSEMLFYAGYDPVNNVEIAPHYMDSLWNEDINDGRELAEFNKERTGKSKKSKKNKEETGKKVGKFTNKGNHAIIQSFIDQFHGGQMNLEDQIEKMAMRVRERTKDKADLYLQAVYMYDEGRVVTSSPSATDTTGMAFVNNLSGLVGYRFAKNGISPKEMKALAKAQGADVTGAYARKAFKKDPQHVNNVMSGGALIFYPDIYNADPEKRKELRVGQVMSVNNFGVTFVRIDADASGRERQMINWPLSWESIADRKNDITFVGTHDMQPAAFLDRNYTGLFMPENISFAMQLGGDPDADDTGNGNEHSLDSWPPNSDKVIGPDPSKVKPPKHPYKPN
jgi:hypothetical protein